MKRADLADLTAFIAVANHLSFRVAASQLGVTPSALSHSMRQLEERLAVRLLNRTTRSVSVSDAGLRLLERLRPAINEIAGALEDLNQERQRPMGRLRIYSIHLAAAAVIAPIWGRFLSTYPEVHLELALGEAPIDIVAKGFDAGIGPRDRVPADMIAVRVMGLMKIAVVGAPTYFARWRPPRTPDDLARHSCVQYRREADGDVLVWPFERNRKSRRISVDGRVMVNDADLAVRAATDQYSANWIGQRKLCRLCRVNFRHCAKLEIRKSKDRENSGTGRNVMIIGIAANCVQRDDYCHECTDKYAESQRAIQKSGGLRLTRRDCAFRHQ